MAEKTTFQVTSKKQFLALLKNSDQQKDKLASISGELGARIKEASDNGYLNRGAFGLMLKLYRMEEDKRADFLRSFDAYRDYADQEQLFGSEHVGDLADMASRSEPDGEAEKQAADEAQTAANVEALEQGIKPLTPQAELADAFERGRIAFLNGEGGTIPADLAGKVGDIWLDGWRSVQLMTVEERSALKTQREGSAVADALDGQAEPFEDDATAKKPSRRRGSKALDGADAPGSYALTAH